MVENDTGRTVCYLYLSPVTVSPWGPDRLGHRVLAPGETDRYAMERGQWNIKAEDCNHRELSELRDVTLAADSLLELH